MLSKGLSRCAPAAQACVLPCLRIGRYDLVLRSWSLRAGWDPAAWAVSERQWLPIDVRGKAALPGLLAQESVSAGFHPGQGWGSQNWGRQGKAKYEASCNTALAWQTYLWMLVWYSRNRETQSCRLLVVSRDFGVAGAERIKGWRQRTLCLS